MESEILLEIKPKYIEYVRFFANMCSPNTGALLIVLICLTPASIPFGLLISELIHVSLSTVMVFLVVIVFTILSLTFAILLILNKRNFEATVYRVYADRIEFEEGFINHKYTTIKMEDIKEIHLIENFIQRKAELGNIKFITAANNSISSTGVCFQDIQNPKVVYAKVKQIHENK